MIAAFRRGAGNEGGTVNLIVTLIVGGIVGWLASVLMKTNKQMGILANVIVGIIGSGLGGFIFSLLNIVALGSLGHLIMSVVGAAVLIALLRGLGVYK
jgi:uncharacterized membrane protein YeaQ/YmgE (transglycosylase-associated protein family)